jgi:hypothetical protein
MDENLHEMLDELDTALELVRANVARIRAELPPPIVGSSEVEMQGFRQSDQLRRARQLRANRAFADFNEDNL